MSWPDRHHEYIISSFPLSVGASLLQSCALGDRTVRYLRHSQTLYWQYCIFHRVDCLDRVDIAVPREHAMSSTPASLKEASLSPRMSTDDGLHQRNDSSPSITPASEEKVPPPEWKPSVRLYVAFLTLAVITLMVALDGTSLSVALPVSRSR